MEIFLLYILHHNSAPSQSIGQMLIRKRKDKVSHIFISLLCQFIPYREVCTIESRSSSRAITSRESCKPETGPSQT